MKRLITLLLLFPIVLFAQECEPNLPTKIDAKNWKAAYYKLKGPVKSMVQYEKGRVAEEFFFDKWGFITKHSIFDASGNISLLKEFSYDEHHNIISCQGQWNGRKIEIVFGYDERGRIISEATHYEGGTDFEKNLYKYDDKGLICENSYYKDNSLLFITRMYHHKNHDIKSDAIYICGTDSCGSPLDSNVYIYNKDKISKKHTFSLLETMSTFAYNEDGRVTSETVEYVDTSWGKELTIYSYFYDNRGNVIESKKTKTDKKEMELGRYEYDHYSNWIKASKWLIKSRDDIKETIKTRTITYYTE